MYSSTQLSRVKLLQQANESLQRLMHLKYASYTNIDQTNSHQQTYQQLTFETNKTIQMYNELIRVYSLSSSPNHINQSDRSSHRSNARSHSRTHAKTELRDQSNNDSGEVFMITTLSCTLAYLYTNFENRLEDAAGILLRAKSQIEECICEGIKNSKQFVKNQQEEEQSQVEEYFIKAKKTNKIIPTLINQVIAQNNNQKLTKYCSSNLPSIKSYIRVTLNLVINLILQKKYTYSVQVFNDLTKFIDSIENKLLVFQCLQFVSLVWFGSTEFLKINSKQRADEFIVQKDAFLLKDRKLTIEQAITASHLIFNLDLLSQKYSSKQHKQPQNFISVLEKSLETFILSEMYEYAFFTLRHLMQSVTQKQNRRQYEYVLNELVINEKLDANISLENIESIECFRCIVETLILMGQKYQDQNENQMNKVADSQRLRLFKLIIKIKMNQIRSDESISQAQKSFILKSFKQMRSQTCPAIIQDLINQQFTQKLLAQVNSHFQIVKQFCQKSLSQTFKLLKSFASFQSRSSRIPLSQRPPHNNQLNQSSLSDNKSQLKNVSVSPSRSKRYLKLISTSIHSETPSVNLLTTQRKPIFQPPKSDTESQIEQKRLNKMVRLCEYGAFLNKRNFNSDGGQFKFIKVTSTSIKWSKTAQKIDQQGQSYPLKDIKGILYGKITPNLNKASNKSLKQEYCFSLVLQKRTMDFYCKDFNEVETWLCGITQILKKNGNQIVGYTPGKMKWRKMFAILRRAYIEPLKIHERNKYYFQNAYSLIMFKENGYKLPMSR